MMVLVGPRSLEEILGEAWIRLEELNGAVLLFLKRTWGGGGGRIKRRGEGGKIPVGYVSYM